MDQAFMQIKNSVKRWLDNVVSTCPHIMINVIIDNNEILRVAFESERCMAEVLVNSASFAPYRYVKMEILSLTSEHPIPIYTWYDSEEDDDKKIIKGLQTGLNLLN